MSNMVIQTNVLALNSHRNLRTVGNKQFNASAKLSSGYKINSAADDASGLAISEKMRAQIRGLDMAAKNSQDGISLIQTAEGGMQEIDNMVQRIRELVVQAANDTNDFLTQDRKKLQDEIEQLTDAIDKMAGQVEFNAKKLLDGSLLDSSTKTQLLGEINSKLLMGVGGTAFTISGSNSALSSVVVSHYGTIGALACQAGLASVYTLGSSIQISISMNGQLVTLGFQAATDGSISTVPISWGTLGTERLSSYSQYQDYIASIDGYIANLQAAKDFAALSEGVDATFAGSDITSLANLNQAIAEAKEAKDNVNKIYDAMAMVYARSDSYNALNDINGNGLWFQTGSNSGQGIIAGVGSIKTDILGIGDGFGTSRIDVNKAPGRDISNFIDIVDNALQYVTAQRAKLGAIQNRLEFTKSSLEISSENLSASESRIRDADMGKEMMRLTAANILQQAGVSMLTQANQNPQSVLQLLR